MSILYCNWSLLWVKLCGRFIEDIDNADFLCVREEKKKDLGFYWIYKLSLLHNQSFWSVLILIKNIQFSSVQSLSVVSDSLQPYESQHARPPCPSPTPGVYSNSCPSSRWCHPAISSSVVPFSSCLQSLPASGSFPRSQLFNNIRRTIIILGKIFIVVEQNGYLAPLNFVKWLSNWSEGIYSSVFTYFPKLKKEKNKLPLNSHFVF